MVWAVGRPWDLGRVAAAFPGVTLTAIGSAWVGWVLGALVASVAAGRPAGKTFGSRQSARATVAAVLALVALGLAAAYRPSGAEPPASVAALGLAPDIGLERPPDDGVAVVESDVGREPE